jgi:hypothetical protein
MMAREVHVDIEVGFVAGSWKTRKQSQTKLEKAGEFDM